MKITLPYKEFKNEFIVPITQINKKGKTAIFFDEDKIYALNQDESHAVNLYNTFTKVSIEDAKPRINLNLSKVDSGLACISTQSDLITFDVTGNELSYKDDMVKFTIRLLDNEIVSIPKIQLNIFQNFPAQNEFILTKDILNKLKRGLDFCSETSKFYVQRQGKNVYIMCGDNTTSHNNSISVLIASDFEGDLIEKVYDTTILRLILASKNDVKFQISNYAINFVIQNESSQLNYITTPLKK